MCIRIQYLSFCFWLTSLCITSSRFIHLIRTDSNMFFLWLSNIPLCICITFLSSSVDGHLGCFHVLTIVNSALMNNGIHVSFSVLVSSGFMPRSGIAESYGDFIPHFLRNPHTVFHSGCINLHSHQQCKNLSVFPYPFHHLLFVDFLMAAILTGGEGNGTPLQCFCLENPMDGGAW